VLRLSANPTIDTAIKCLAVVAVMFAFVFVVMVPMYNVLCNALGINGKPANQAYTAASTGVDESRTVTIEFLANRNAGMPWEFSAGKTRMEVHPGAVNDAVFFARNPMPKMMVAQAIPSISPAQAAQYFHKTECFCFRQQPLGGNSSAELPVQFIVDKDLPKEIRTITLSYTMFDVTEMAGAAVVAR
jgi:cytochrome c oxidase assembly protein subunit 11